jgi:L,D-peptidoglycan transpeptidase YkuD (ErfK/YbiS/YcfS/YnhG family)
MRRATVASTLVVAGVRARISLWRLAADGWERQLTTADGRTGYGGLVDGDRRRQGSGTTPLGTYGLISTFGTHAADRRALLPHHRIRKGDHWVQDNASDFYNQLRNRRDGGFRWWLPRSDPDSSERLTDYPRQYEWSIVTDFNVEQVHHRGSGIFLHVNGRGATAGCVSAPRRFIRSLVRLLDPSRVPVIGIGR